MAYEDPFDIVEGVEDYCSGVAEANLEDGMTVLFPPLFADRGVVVAELQEVPKEGYGSGDFWYAFDVGYVGSC